MIIEIALGIALFFVGLITVLIVLRLVIEVTAFLFEFIGDCFVALFSRAGLILVFGGIVCGLAWMAIDDKPAPRPVPTTTTLPTITIFPPLPLINQ